MTFAELYAGMSCLTLSAFVTVLLLFVMVAASKGQRHD
jgi:hypothetical protein